MQEKAKIHPYVLSRILKDAQAENIYSKNSQGKWCLKDAKYTTAEHEDRRLKHSQGLVRVLEFLRNAPVRQIMVQEILLYSYVHGEHADFEVLREKNCALVESLRRLSEKVYPCFDSALTMQLNNWGKRDIVKSDFSIEAYCAIRIHLASYKYISEAFKKMLFAYVESDVFLEKIKSLRASEEYRQLSFRDTGLCGVEKLTAEERKKLEDYDKECHSLLDQSFDHKVERGLITKFTVDKFDGDIKRLIKSIVRDNLPLEGECPFCPK
ncbi:MAG: hypothetical protein LBH79_00810 [Nitrososphaerota archaeon]|nr:hypothetical protein [Nitrososphaerota archaeon]